MSYLDKLSELISILSKTNSTKLTDYLLCGDVGDDTFLERFKEIMEENTNG